MSSRAMIRKIVGACGLFALLAGCSGIGSSFSLEGNATPESSGNSAAPGPGPAALNTVQQVQEALHTQNLYNGPIDGIIGPRTRSALLAYQHLEGLAPTGTSDTATIASLAAAARIPSSESTGTTGSSTPSEPSEPLE
jgi:peptidoglycan hydrolase-like protein with peptidoglycan-binding domain